MSHTKIYGLILSAAFALSLLSGCGGAGTALPAPDRPAATLPPSSSEV